MNLRNLILEKHSKEQMLLVVDYVGNNKKKFDELMHLFLFDDYRVSQRASWAVLHCIQKNPSFAKKYLPMMLDNLKNPIHDAVVRNTIRILDIVEIPENLHAQVMDICYELVTKNTSPIAVKAFSIGVLTKLSKLYPELKNELKAIIDDQLPTASPAIKSRAKRIK